MTQYEAAHSRHRLPGSGAKQHQGQKRSGYALLALAACGLCLFTPPALRAQLNTATLQGTAVDAGGSVIPDSAVSVRNTETGVVRTATTGAAGEYTVNALQPGVYEVTISHNGFQTSKQTDVTLTVGEIAALTSTLPVGRTEDTIEVKTTSGQLETTDTSLGTVIEQKQVVDLPLNGRQFTQLIQLQPGVVPIDNSQNCKMFLTDGVASKILGGFQINSIVTARSGIVINPTDPFNADRANAGGGNQRLNFVSDPNAGAPHSHTNYFNPAAFAEAALDTYGTSGLNSLRGPGFFDADLSLFRDVAFTERAKVQLRVETFNIFNHPNLGNPGISFNSQTSTFTNPISSYAGNYNPRVTQLAAKLVF